MNRASLGKIGPILLGFYALSFIILFLFSLIIPPPDIMKYFYLNSALKWALYYFIEFIIPIHCTAVLIIYSLFIDTGERQVSKGSLVLKFVSSPLILFMILTVLYIICLLWIQPLVLSGIKDNEIKSEMARNYYNLADSEVTKSRTVIGEMKEKHLRDAFLYIESCLKINPKYNDAEILERKIRQNIIDTGTRLIEEEENQPATENKHDRNYIREANADQLLKKAQEFYNNEKYFSAYYYASTAFKLDKNLLDAYSLSERAMEKISSINLSKKDEEIKDLAYNKKDWYRKIKSGEFLTVYYYFKELNAQYPNDPDIKDYLKEIEEDFINNFTFYYDSVKHIDYLPGTNKIIFINYSDEKGKQFIYIDKMVNSVEGIFFKDLEVLTISSTGKVISHLKAPYGKYVFVDPADLSTMQGRPPTKHHINIHCIRSYNPDISPYDYDYKKDTEISPYFYVEPPEGERGLSYIIPLYPDIRILNKFQGGRTAFNTTGLLELFLLSLNNQYVKAGFSRKEVNFEIVSRFIYPFMFLFLSLLSIAIGWACRSRYMTRPPLLTLFFIPLFPVVVAFLSKLYLLTQRILFGFIVMLFDLIPTLIICLVFQSIAVVLALIIIAGKLTK